VAEDAKQRVGLAVMLETLEYLARGGRIGKAAFMLGNLIKINPILSIKDGEVTPISRARGENHAIPAIVEYVARQAEGNRKLHLAIVDADAPEQAARFGGISLAKVATDRNLPHGIHARNRRSYRAGVVGLGYYYE